MYYKKHYKSPIGNIIIASNEKSIVGLWFDKQNHIRIFSHDEIEEKNITVLEECKKWLDDYFAGKKPEISRLPLAPEGSEFRQHIWKILCEIPYGCTMSYGNIAKEAAMRMGKERMSAQAVGGAVGHNPISIIIPCHRVVGSSGSLTGYAGGIDKKIKLLSHEGVDMSNLFVPKSGTAL